MFTVFATKLYKVVKNLDGYELRWAGLLMVFMFDKNIRPASAVNSDFSFQLFKLKYKKLYFLKSLDDGFRGLLVFPFDLGDDFLVELILILLVLLSHKELVFDRLQLFLKELPELEGVVSNFFFEQENFFVKIVKICAEEFVELFDLFGVLLNEDKNTITASRWFLAFPDCSPIVLLKSIDLLDSFYNYNLFRLGIYIKVSMFVIKKFKM